MAVLFKRLAKLPHGLCVVIVRRPKSSKILERHLDEIRPNQQTEVLLRVFYQDPSCLLVQMI
jgi:hypothetical protein